MLWEVGDLPLSVIFFFPWRFLRAALCICLVRFTLDQHVDAVQHCSLEDLVLFCGRLAPEHSSRSGGNLGQFLPKPSICEEAEAGGRSGVEEVSVLSRVSVFYTAACRCTCPAVSAPAGAVTWSPSPFPALECN